MQIYFLVKIIKPKKFFNRFVRGFFATAGKVGTYLTLPQWIEVFGREVLTHKDNMAFFRSISAPLPEGGVVKRFGFIACSAHIRRVAVH